VLDKQVPGYRIAARGYRIAALVLGIAGLAATAPGPALAAPVEEAPIERISLPAAIERALSKNPSVAFARQEIARSEAIVREVRAGALPTLTGNGTYTRLDDDRRLPPAAATAANPNPVGTVIAGRDQIALNLQLAVPLVNAQRWKQWEHAGDNVKVAEVSAAEVRRQIAVSVARAYLAVVTQHRVLEVNERARTTARAHVEFATTRLRGGVGNKLDEVRAGQELATVVAQLEGARATLARAQETLGVVAAAEEPLDTLADLQLPEAGPLTSALEAAERARPDIEALRQRKAAADNVLRDSWADYMPLLSAVAQPFYQNPASLTTPTTGWQAQLLLTVPFYDGGLRYGLRDERSALAAQARDNLEGALRQARAEVRGAFTALLRADDALRAARDGARLGQEALELANLAYRQGAVTSLDVIDAERRARDAETTAALAEDSARQARLDLLTASGAFP
jgi:outer membrane protein TolC